MWMFIRTAEKCDSSTYSGVVENVALCSKQVQRNQWNGCLKAWRVMSKGTCTNFCRLHAGKFGKHECHVSGVSDALQVISYDKLEGYSSTWLQFLKRTVSTKHETMSCESFQAIFCMAVVMVMLRLELFRRGQMVGSDGLWAKLLDMFRFYLGIVSL